MTSDFGADYPLPRLSPERCVPVSASSSYYDENNRSRSAPMPTRWRSQNPGERAVLALLHDAYQQRVNREARIARARQNLTPSGALELPPLEPDPDEPSTPESLWF